MCIRDRKYAVKNNTNILLYLFFTNHIIFTKGQNPASIFFKQKTAYEISRSDWSSDVCSSDLARFPSVLNEPLSASVTFLEATAPVKLPT